MKRLLALVFVACACSSPSTKTRNVNDGPAPQGAVAAGVPLAMKVTAWAAYTDGGENYIHLWSPGAPKSVVVVRERDVSKDFLATLRREVPETHGVMVTIPGGQALVESPTYVTNAQISGLVQYGSGSGYGDAK
jgi:hypothetical protein